MKKAFYLALVVIVAVAMALLRLSFKSLSIENPYIMYVGLAALTGIGIGVLRKIFSSMDEDD